MNTKLLLVTDRPAVPVIEDHYVEGTYKKASYQVYEDGHVMLFSYDTPVILKNPDGTFCRLWMGRTQTTSRHIKSFFGLTSKDVDALPYMDPSDVPMRVKYHFEEVAV